jgi:NDP-mannose synthase
MRVIILAGGKGVRLAPLTEVIPKPLVPLGGKPILEIIIRQLKAQGFRRITLALGYLSDLIKAYFQDGSRWGVEIDYSLEPQPLGTAGPLALIEGMDETFMVMNADVLSNINYGDLVGYHLAQKGIGTIAAFEREIKIDLGLIIKDGNGRIKDYVEKPTKHYLVSMGIYIFEPHVLTYIPENCYLDFPDLIRLLLYAGLPICYYHFGGYWLDIGRHDDYNKAIDDFSNNFEEPTFQSATNTLTSHYNNYLHE